MKSNFISIAIAFFLCFSYLFAQEADISTSAETTESKNSVSNIESEVAKGGEEKGEKQGGESLIEELKFIKQPGLANAASKVFFSDRPFSISGFVEINNVNTIGGDSRLESDDLELFYSGLYRLGTYIGYRFTDKLVLNSEVQLEFLHNRTYESDFAYTFELMIDYLMSPELSFRFGNMPIPLGYVNVMEEPTAFYSVNRPELERTLIPTQWLDFGFMIYGKVTDDLEYNLGVVKGLNAANFNEGTWIRGGRFMDFGIPENVAVFGKLEYTGVENLTVAAATYHGNSGFNNDTPDGRRLSAPLTITSAYLQYDYKNFTLFGVGALGNLGGTDDIYAISERVIGSRTMGYYGELRCNIMHYFDQSTQVEIPVFLRLEQLKTHAGVHTSLENLERDELDLLNYTIGINFRPNRHLALKANYQFRNNRSAMARFVEGNRFELGLGLIF